CARYRHGKRRSPNPPCRPPRRHEPVTLALAIQPPRRIRQRTKPPGSLTRRLFVSGSRSADTERHLYVERLVRGRASSPKWLGILLDARPQPRLGRVCLINRLTVRRRAGPPAWPKRG